MDTNSTSKSIWLEKLIYEFVIYVQIFLSIAQIDSRYMHKIEFVYNWFNMALCVCVCVLKGTKQSNQSKFVCWVFIRLFLHRWAISSFIVPSAYNVSILVSLVVFSLLFVQFHRSFNSEPKRMFHMWTNHPKLAQFECFDGKHRNGQSE